MENMTTSIRAGAARTQAPAVTSYDVRPPTWGDVMKAHLQSAMEATYLSHEISCSPTDLVHVSMLCNVSLLPFMPCIFAPAYCSVYEEHKPHSQECFCT